MNQQMTNLPKDALCQIWFKSAKWLLRRSWIYKKFTNRLMDGGHKVISIAYLAHSTVRLKVLILCSSFQVSDNKIVSTDRQTDRVFSVYPFKNLF